MSALQSLLSRYTPAADPLRTERRLELLLILAALVVLLQLLWLGLRWAGAVNVEAVLPTADSLTVLEPEGPAPISTEQSLRLQSRPLFWASRAPADGLRLAQAAEGAVPSDGESEYLGEPARRLEKLELTGIFGGGDSGGAIIEYRGNRMRLLVGQELDGWTLQRVEPGSAVFFSAGVIDERTLQTAIAASGDSNGDRADSAGGAAGAAAPAERPAVVGRPAARGPAPTLRRPEQEEPAEAQAQRSLSVGGS